MCENSFVDETCANILRNYANEQLHSLQGMSEEVERIMKLIRELKRFADYWTIQSETEKAKYDDARSKLQMANETIRSVFTRFPHGHVPTGDNDLDRLEVAVAHLLQAMNEVSLSFH